MKNKIKLVCLIATFIIICTSMATLAEDANAKQRLPVAEVRAEKVKVVTLNYIGSDDPASLLGFELEDNGMPKYHEPAYEWLNTMACWYTIFSRTCWYGETCSSQCSG